MKTIHIQHGFSMIEILVSVMVISIGLLGMAMLQTNSVRYSQDAYLSSIASSHAYEMLDRMRANPEAVDNGNYDFSGGIPTVAPGCTTCNPADNAARDAFTWNQTLATMLPSGAGEISFNAATGRYTVTVKWDRRPTDAPNPVCGSNPLTNLSCFSVELVQ
ncbi:MAG: type IV pilus modification protein PilV [Legionellales bacterium]|nr:type IV pilus modification protein PilV [Legionellales bacterium]